MSMTHSAGAAALVSHSHWRTESQGRAMPVLGEYNVANVYSLLLPSHALCLGLWGAGGCLKAHPRVPGDVLLLNRCNLFLGVGS